ncbi:ShlB/FhaC/HecB family hemolysin secretion/activation protein [Albidovulum sediminicola]|uniref:ShlB/FhaC/HecB family hemolysin secretion/activation protein n=1 Tax=Albidovulum sediminicola TaxID=2984331 RepID=UPI0021E933F1|nr:ShlB/FhaC/HecB family hemolysin secretion/activation protein [Defluviimonas sp. WL0075]
MSVLTALVLSISAASAQSFFTNLGTDPSTGVDRGSASVIRKVDRRTGFLTFSSIGTKEIGPYIASGTLAWPDLIGDGDQLDLVLVLGGLSESGGLELAAAGAGYRRELPGTGVTIFANADHGDFALGSATSKALAIEGTQTNAAIGARKVWNLPQYSRLTASVEMALRNSHIEILGATAAEERLRMLRAALRYERGLPYGFQQRYGLSVTKGIDGLGASASAGPRLSAPGVATDFLRIAFSAEMSVPLSARFLVNAGVVGQWTNDSLPVSQRCGYGTNAYARGFDLSYVNGDRCLGSRVELAYNLILPDPRAKVLDLRQAFLGVDGGAIKDMPNPLIPGNSDRWSSVSAGLRVAKGAFVGEVALSHILDKPAGAFPQDDTRLWFQAGFSF